MRNKKEVVELQSVDFRSDPVDNVVLYFIISANSEQLYGSGLHPSP